MVKYLFEVNNGIIGVLNTKIREKQKAKDK